MKAIHKGALALVLLVNTGCAALQWTTSGFDGQAMANWEAFGFTDPTEAASWRDSGFNSYDAAQWKAYGFGNAEMAAKWRQFMAPALAATWLSAGVAPEVAGPASKASLSPTSLKEWELAGVKAQEAIAWSGAGVAGPVLAKEWIEQKITPQEYAERVGPLELEPKEFVKFADTVKNWRETEPKLLGMLSSLTAAGVPLKRAKSLVESVDNKFIDWALPAFLSNDDKAQPKLADTISGAAKLLPDWEAWKSASFNAKLAVMWKSVKFTPEEASEWHRAISINMDQADYEWAVESFPGFASKARGKLFSPEMIEGWSNASKSWAFLTQACMFAYGSPEYLDVYGAKIQKLRFLSEYCEMFANMESKYKTWLSEAEMKATNPYALVGKRAAFVATSIRFINAYKGQYQTEYGQRVELDFGAQEAPEGECQILAQCIRYDPKTDQQHFKVLGRFW